ncbi:MAG: hypothetical protein DWH91_06100 [Planctomycetota bacterium]|nr:MAG: hypothetical protein DWH91_06100 [Planctomycetota bacterium]
MFRVLLMFLIVWQAGFPSMGTCLSDDRVDIAEHACRTPPSSSSQATCCQTPATETPDDSSGCPISGEGSKPCCGCCLVSMTLFLQPEMVWSSSPAICEVVIESNQRMIGLTRSPMTPPPDKNGMG